MQSKRRKRLEATAYQKDNRSLRRRPLLVQLFCNRYGREWISPAVPFAAGILIAIEYTEARELLWVEERRAAFTEANLEARLHFNTCPRRNVPAVYNGFASP